MERKTLKETLKRSFSETLYLSSPGTMYTVPGEHAPPGGCRPTLHPPQHEEGDSEKWAGFPPSEAPPNRAGPQSSHSSSKPGGAQGAQQPPLREFSSSSRPAADRSCRCDSPAWGWPGDGGTSVPRCRTAVKRNHRDAHARADTEPAPRDRPHPRRTRALPAAERSRSCKGRTHQSGGRLQLDGEGRRGAFRGDDAVWYFHRVWGVHLS